MFMETNKNTSAIQTTKFSTSPILQILYHILYIIRKTKAILEIEGIVKSVLISAQKTAAVDLFQKTKRTVGDVKCNAFIKLIALWANRSLSSVV